MKPLPFSLTQIEYALAVFRTRHFGEAAKECGITQPTLSMQIQKLEEDLGCVLFDRSKKPILITELGQVILLQFQEIYFQSHKALDILDKSRGPESGWELKIGIIPTLAPYLLPRLLQQKVLNLKEAKLRFFELQTEVILAKLEDDSLDVGLLATPLNQPKIFEHALFYEPFHVICQKDHELAKHKKIKSQNLTKPDLWLLSEGHCLRNQVLDICSLQKSQNNFKEKSFTFESGGMDTLIHLVAEFGGHTLIPSLARKNVPENCKVLDFERPIPSREIGLVYRREHYKLDAIEALADLILISIPEEIRKLRPKDLAILPVTS